MVAAALAYGRQRLRLAAVKIGVTEYARELGLTGLRGWLAVAGTGGRGPRATDRPNLSG